MRALLQGGSPEAESDSPVAEAAARLDKGKAPMRYDNMGSQGASTSSVVTAQMADGRPDQAGPSTQASHSDADLQALLQATQEAASAFTSEIEQIPNPSTARRISAAERTQALTGLSQLYAPLPPSQAETIQALTAYIATGMVPGPTTAAADAYAKAGRAIAETDACATAGMAVLSAAQAAGGGLLAGVRGARAACVRAAQAANAGLQAMMSNEFQSNAAANAASLANVAVRNFASVFVTTAIRQFLSYGFQAAFDKSGASDNTKAAFGILVAPVAATTALAMGAMRDEWAGTATPTSRQARGIMFGATAVTGLATMATGSMAGAAPLMLAFTAYTAMRDLVVQSRLRMDAPNTADTPPNANHYAAISALYGLDQALVDYGMSQLASPSGAGAYAAGASLSTQALNTAMRALLNWGGEVGEDLAFQGIGALRAGSELRLQIEDVGYQQHHLANAFMGPWAVRTGILSMTIGMTSMLSRLLPDSALEGLPVGVDQARAMLDSAVIGLTNAVLYQPFAEAGGAQPQREHYDRLRSVEAPPDVEAPALAPQEQLEPVDAPAEAAPHAASAQPSVPATPMSPVSPAGSHLELLRSYPDRSA